MRRKFLVGCPLIIALLTSVPQSAVSQGSENMEDICERKPEICKSGQVGRPSASTYAGSSGGLSDGEMAVVGGGLAILGGLVDSMIAQSQSQAMAPEPRRPAALPATTTGRTSSPMRPGMWAEEAGATLSQAGAPSRFAAAVERTLASSLRQQVSSLYARTAGQGLGAMISRAFGGEFYADRTIDRLSDLAGELILSLPSLSSLRERAERVTGGLKGAIVDLYERELKVGITNLMER